MNYFIVTPVKNEETNLPSLIKSIKSQTIKPFLWIIVDDGSTDRSPMILKKLENETNWVHIITLKESKEYMGMHVSYVCKQGFNYGLKYCKDHKIKYDYIGLLDADVILENEYYKKLIKEFHNNPKLGLISGEAYFKKNNKFVSIGASENIIAGGARLWRRACYLETGGFQITRAADTVSSVKAELSGWKIKRFLNIKMFPARNVGTKKGAFWGFKDMGKTDYYLNYHPTLTLLKSIRMSFVKPYYLGIAYLTGYLHGFLLRMEKTKDEEIRNYFWNDRIKIAINNFFKQY